MIRFPIVANFEKLKTEGFEPIQGKIGEVVINDDAVESAVSIESQAGRPVYLTILMERRADGIFPVAGMFSVIPVPVAAEQEIPPKADEAK